MSKKIQNPQGWTLPPSPLQQNAGSDALLDSLQANILKGHGRDHTANLFLAIEDPALFKVWLRHFTPTSTTKQLTDTKKFKNNPNYDGGTMSSIGFSAAGLSKLGHDVKALFPAHKAFAAGMAERTALNDSPANSWDFQDAQVWILLADVSLARLNVALKRLLSALGSGVSILRIERGCARKNPAGEGIEHFGYVDGRSQPLFLASDLAEEDAGGGINVFNPSAPLRQVLVQDPFTPDSAFAAGSFLVFRKLEQRVAAFKARELELAEQLGLEGEDRERAGALLVGRFEDGTPVATSEVALGLKPPNNFDYAGINGARCPMHAHIRKVNARNGAITPLLMARRGITYGERGVEEAPFPEDGVGLLFAAYMSSIEEQFEIAQMSWANTDIDPLTGTPSTGADGVIGQGIEKPQCWTAGTGQNLKFKFADFVAMRGGEYFYVPSIRGVYVLGS